MIVSIASLDDVAFELAGASVHVWHIDLGTADTIAAKKLDTLDDEERRRASRLRMPEDRAQFIVAHALARELLGRYLACTAASVCIAVHAGGKPHLLLQQGEPDLRFNASRTNGHAAFAFTLKREVGIDVEGIGRNADFAALYRRVLSERERRALEALTSEAARREAFFAYWARKEALLKAKGDGLRIPPVEIDTALALRRLHLPGDRRDWRVEDFAVPGCAAAVAAEGTDWCAESVRSYCAQDLLAELHCI